MTQSTDIFDPAKLSTDELAHFKQMQAENERLRAKDRLRWNLENVADTRTREGITADTVALLVYGLAEVIHSINTASSLTDLKTKLKDRAPSAKQLLDGVAAGQIKLPYLSAKDGGVAAVMHDFIRLNNGVTDVLKAHAPKPAATQPPKTEAQSASNT